MLPRAGKLLEEFAEHLAADVKRLVEASRGIASCVVGEAPEGWFERWQNLRF